MHGGKEGPRRDRPQVARLFFEVVMVDHATTLLYPEIDPAEGAKCGGVDSSAARSSETAAGKQGGHKEDRSLFAGRDASLEQVC